MLLLNREAGPYGLLEERGAPRCAVCCEIEAGDIRDVGGESFIGREEGGADCGADWLVAGWVGECIVYWYLSESWGVERDVSSGVLLVSDFVVREGRERGYCELPPTLIIGIAPVKSPRFRSSWRVKVLGCVSLPVKPGGLNTV